ncbi:PQQ-binding-like beta-propeller repeat protein [Bacillus sp. FSL W8-0519]|uniref:PQQ-binding-like beta-propeller repeat protein n=1 Tax=Bacillus sp. FSL W8-0519 TaxID=2954624 RepID=UPI000936A217
MPYLQEHGFGGSSLGLKRVINVFIQKAEPKALLKGDIWVKTDIPPNKVLLLEEGLEAPKEEGNIWIILKDIEMKMVLEKIVKVFSNKKEINMDYSRNSIISNINLNKLHVFKNKFMQIYSMFGIAKMYRNGKWEWLIADYWDGTKWVNFSNLQVYVYYATYNGQVQLNANSTVKQITSHDGSPLWGYNTTYENIQSLAVDKDGYVMTGEYVRGKLTRLSPNGSVAWGKTASERLGGLDRSGTPAIAVDKDGFIYEGLGLILVKRDTQGKEVWKRTINESDGSITQIVTDKDNNIFVLFNTGATSNSIRARVFRFDPSGSQIFNLPASNAGNNFAFAMNNTHVFIGANGGTIVRITKDGKEVKQFNLGFDCNGLGIAVDANNLFFTFRDGVAKYDQNFQQIWRCKFADKAESVDIVLSKDGFIYAAARSKSIKKIAPDGKELWSIGPEQDEITRMAIFEGPYATFADLW